jgi:phage protein D
LGNSLDRLAPQVEVRIAGAKLPEAMAATLTAVTVSEDVDAPGMFTLELAAWDLARGDLRWIDDDRFSLGNVVEISIGYGNQLQRLITGEITGLEPEFALGSDPILVVRGHDPRHRLLRGTKTRSFVQMKDSAIASQIVAEHNISSQVEDTKVNLEYVLQHSQTDWEFLKSRAERLGYEIAMEDKTLHFRSHPLDKPKVLTLTREDELIFFSPRLSSLNQVKQVEVRSWLPKEKKVTLAKAAAGNETTMGGSNSGPKAAAKAFGASSYTMVNQLVGSQAEADGIALGQLNEMAIGYITGEGTCLGNSKVRAGKVIEITGVGKKFSGLYYVTATNHRYSQDGGYRTQFTVGRNTT